MDAVLADFSAGDILLLQNEVNLLPYIVNMAYEKGMQIALNPSPYNEKLQAVDLSIISFFLVNEVEGGQITGISDPKEILQAILEPGTVRTRSFGTNPDARSNTKLTDVHLN